MVCIDRYIIVHNLLFQCFFKSNFAHLCIKIIFGERSTQHNFSYSRVPSFPLSTTDYTINNILKDVVAKLAALTNTACSRKVPPDFCPHFLWIKLFPV